MHTDDVSNEKPTETVDLPRDTQCHSISIASELQNQSLTSNKTTPLSIQAPNSVEHSTKKFTPISEQSASLVVKEPTGYTIEGQFYQSTQTRFEPEISQETFQ